MQFQFAPAFFSLFKNKEYSAKQFYKDAIAGVIVGIVALPLAIAFAIASGVNPQQGIYTAVIAGFIISALGGSKVQIGGPTGAFIVVVFGIVQQYGYSGLAAATMLAGCLLIFMGAAKLGSVIKYIPYPMTVGFTAGIAVIIGGSQLKDFLGIAGNISGLTNQIKAIDYHTAVIGLISLIIIIAWQKFNKTLPGSIIAILVSTLIVSFFGVDTPTIGSRFGALPAKLPMPAVPDFSLSMLPDLIRPAFTIALLGAIESLLSAVVADGMISTRHNSNTELIAQGIANIASPLFGGIPATGAIARTATNIKNGGSSPVSGIVHAITLLCLLLFLGRWVSMVPIATLSAILLVVAYHMSEWQHFVKLMHSPKTDILVLITTFLITIFVDLTAAIEVGVVLSAILFMKRMSDVTHFNVISSEASQANHASDFKSVNKEDIPDGVKIFEIHGPFFFGAANKFKDTLSIVAQKPEILIIRMSHVLTIDATGIRAFEEMIDKIQKDKTKVFLSGVKPEIVNVLASSGLVQKIDNSNIFPNIEEALQKAKKQLADNDSSTENINQHIYVSGEMSLS